MLRQIISVCESNVFKNNRYIWVINATANE
ncbi:Uncharacterised protein [Neisseria meningitidis]|nr:hypothetical protein NMNM586_1800 [Neisseria meningitidis NM586]ELK95979.1 hypothetical protein NMNM126_1102 [Neisseria meningitidis NM126]EOB93938.1 hypothetical protein NM133_1043 [Neisseria meningitidis NM133]EOC00163.1 hypothetical protein NM94_1006 [Neisseria meningitidis NM94]EOC00368.1 hypothetical protein NM82_1009 [Neisseria meningitidis NM82]EOC02936.1 hypothetical protein NM95_0996 [Neisseria meningitidis NM95]CWM86222.1 Uncharacterised protein [Neisseria meningitidis]